MHPYISAIAPRGLRLGPGNPGGPNCRTDRARARALTPCPHGRPSASGKAWMADQMSGFKEARNSAGGPRSRLAQAATQLQSEVPPCAPWEQTEILRARLEEFFSAQREVLQQVLGNFSNTLAHDVDTDLCHVGDYAADELLSIAESYRDAPKEAVE